MLRRTEIQEFRMEIVQSKVYQLSTSHQEHRRSEGPAQLPARVPQLLVLLAQADHLDGTTKHARLNGALLAFLGKYTVPEVVTYSLCGAQ
jgi:hypothetical protein